MSCSVCGTFESSFSGAPIATPKFAALSPSFSAISPLARAFTRESIAPSAGEGGPEDPELCASIRVRRDAGDDAGCCAVGDGVDVVETRVKKISRRYPMPSSYDAWAPVISTFVTSVSDTSAIELRTVYDFSQPDGMAEAMLASAVWHLA